MTYRDPRATGWGELSTLPCVVSEYGWYHHNTERYNIDEVTDGGDTYTVYDEKSYLAFTDRETDNLVINEFALIMGTKLSLVTKLLFLVF